MSISTISIFLRNIVLLFKNLKKMKDWNSVNILDTFCEENLKASALRLLVHFYEIIK